MRVTLYPAAERDIEEAAAFYGREGVRRRSRPGSFLEFKAVSTLRLRHPEIGSPRPAGRRGLSMNVFPYTVIYRVIDDEIKVLLVKHDRKRPNHS